MTHVPDGPVKVTRPLTALKAQPADDAPSIESVTASPEDAVAAGAYDPNTRAFDGAVVVNRNDCAPLASSCCTWVACRYPVLPGWFASTSHGPELRIVSVFPDSEQLDPLMASTVSDTASPDDADAVTGN